MVEAVEQLAYVILLNSGDQGGGGWRGALVTTIHGEHHRGERNFHLQMAVLLNPQLTKQLTKNKR